MSEPRDSSLESPITIPTLPPELILLILQQLTTLERRPLGLTSKLLRELDLAELGPRVFDVIEVEWTMNTIRISGKVAVDGGMVTACAVRGTPLHPILTSDDNLRFFKNATTKSVVIKYIRPNRDCVDPELIVNIFKTVSCKKFQADFFATLDNTDTNFTFNLDLSNAEVLFRWRYGEDHNIEHVREILTRLPPMAKFKMEWQLHGEQGRPGREHVIDDATLRHIASNTVDCHLMAYGELTFRAILDVFEIVCESQLPTKYVQTNVKRDVMDAIFFDPTLPFEKVHPHGVIRELVDAQRDTILTATNTAIYIQKGAIVAPPRQRRARRKRARKVDDSEEGRRPDAPLASVASAS